MKALFCEGDGTTWEYEVQVPPPPELRAPLLPRFLACSEPQLFHTVLKTRRYRLVGVSQGEIAFYDRVVDPEEIR
jgi:hypothetical protein